MSQALHAEWTKLRTMPGTGWLLLAMVAATVIISATVSAAVSCSSTAACHVDVTRLSLTGTYLGQAVVALVAVLAVSGEYGTGLISTTLAAMPHRTTVLAAKAAVVTAVTLAAGTLAVLGSVVAGQLILPGHGYTPANGYPALSLADGPVVRAAAAQAASTPRPAHGLIGRWRRPVLAWISSPAVIGPICCRCRATPGLPTTWVRIGNR